MSLQALAWVLDFSESTRTARLVMFSLANHADKYGEKIFPSIKTISEEAKCSERAVQYALRELEELGEIQQAGKTRSGTNVYRMVMGGATVAPQQEGGVQTTTSRGASPAPEPSGTVRETTDVVSVERERASASLKFRSRKVDPVRWELSQQILTEFNRQTGRHLRPVTSGGSLSAAAKEIYHCVSDYTDLGLVDFERIIRNTLASRWWGDGKPSIGVVFGAKVFEENISRSPVALVSRGRVSEKERLLAEQRESIRRNRASGALDSLFGKTAS